MPAGPRTVKPVRYRTARRRTMIHALPAARASAAVLPERIVENVMVDIPVLCVLPAEEAMRAVAPRTPQGFLGFAAAAPSRAPGVAIDPTFAPIPLGAGDARAVTFESSTVERAERFVVRASIDAARLADYAEPREGMRVFADPAIAALRSPPICPGQPALGSAPQVRGLLGVDGLTREGLTGRGVALAIVDTGIDLAHLRRQGLSPTLDPHISWSPGTGTRPGANPLGHGTMCAHAALIAAPEATLLDFPVLQSRRQGGSIMDGLLSDAVQAFGVLLTMMRTPAEERPYRALVVNNSWGMFHPDWDFPAGHPGRYADNPDHPFNLIVGALASAGADILFAAGNCGHDCPDGRCRGLTVGQITGANSHPGVLTVAGVDVERDVVGYSSGGPGAWTDEKPDLAAYTHYLGSEAFGDGSADGGTSTACPVAAGCVAALRTSLKPGGVPPAQLFQALRDAAVRRSEHAGWHDRYGWGVIDPLAAWRALHVG